MGVKEPVPNRAVRFQREILPFFPPHLRLLLAALPTKIFLQGEEIRLRVGRPLCFRLTEEELFLAAPAGGPEGRPLAFPPGAFPRISPYLVTSEDLGKILQLLSQGSFYTLEEELRRGYLTLPGGHRVGLVGEAVLEKGHVKTLKHISGLNIRFASAVVGSADSLLPFLLPKDTQHPCHTLLISPPRGGKTTLLRDLVRQLSDGVPELGFPGVNVGVVDERSEIAGCYQGVPQHDVGLRTDVLDHCPKAEGMLMLLRSMAPEVVATDELGGGEDLAVITEMLKAGVTVITTLHGENLTDLKSRPPWKHLLQQKIFERYVICGRSLGPGTIEAIFAADGSTGLIRSPFRGPKERPARLKKESDWA